MEQTIPGGNAPRQSRRGVIVLVQEHRFRLLGADGQQTLHVVGPQVPVGVDDLQRWMDEGTTIDVLSLPSGKTRAAVAVSLDPVPGGNG